MVHNASCINHSKVLHELDKVFLNKFSYTFIDLGPWVSEVRHASHLNTQFRKETFPSVRKDKMCVARSMHRRNNMCVQNFDN